MKKGYIIYLNVGQSYLSYYNNDKSIEIFKYIDYSDYVRNENKCEDILKIFYTKEEAEEWVENSKDCNGCFGFVEIKEIYYKKKI